MSTPGSPPVTITGQVCDRCRAKKIKCNGAVPACKNCVTAGAECIVSATLRRKTKLRGFKSNTDEEIARLRTENERLRRDLQSESEANGALRKHIEELKLSAQPSVDLAYPSASSLAQTELLYPSHGVQKDLPLSKSALLIKHMGRLVADEDGQERFAGSTTGVHFIWLVQQILQGHGVAYHRFPENCYRLHLLSPTKDNFPVATPAMGSTNHNEQLLMCLKQIFSKPMSVYMSCISLFDENWSPFCPVLGRSDLIRHVANAQTSLRQGTTVLPAEVFAHCFQMVVIMLLNSTKANPEQTINGELFSIKTLVSLMLPHISARADLMSLQGLAIFSLYNLVTGKVLQMPSLSGILVRIAHLLGLHRHNRRFKFNAGQIELRKRLWWYIYFFDKITSAILGLPQLIQDIDIDVDCPADCELEEVDGAQITWPLPGEVSHTMNFLALIHLSRILAVILEKLYTTTQRRNGPEKMAQLRDDLLAWRQKFKQYSTDADDVESAALQDNSPLRLWLHIVDNFAMMLIHLPGLTFDQTTQQFRDCLEHCVSACSSIITLSCTYRAGSSVLGIIPIGPSLLFQCGLMHVLYHADVSTRSPPESSRNPLISKELLDRIIDILSQYETFNYASLNEARVRTHSHTSPIFDACQLLRTLGDSVILTNTRAPNIIGEPPVPSNSAPENATFQSTAFEADAGLGFLEALNDFDFTNWAVDSPFATLPDLG